MMSAVWLVWSLYLQMGGTSALIRQSCFHQRKNFDANQGKFSLITAMSIHLCEQTINMGIKKHEWKRA